MPPSGWGEPNRTKLNEMVFMTSPQLHTAAGGIYPADPTVAISTCSARVFYNVHYRRASERMHAARQSWWGIFRWPLCLFFQLRYLAKFVGRSGCGGFRGSITISERLIELHLSTNHSLGFLFVLG